MVLAVLLLAAPLPAAANPESARLRARAYESAYNLDYDQATREMEAAVKADPDDPAAERGLAVIPWLLISFSRGTVTVDDYLGALSRQSMSMRPPPADLAARFTPHAARSLTLAEAQLRARPRDAEAHYQVGAIVGLQATYTATVEGKVLAGFRAARRAYNMHEQALALDPARKDAGLVVGMYRYIVAISSMPLRMVAYVAGFGGGKERGIEMVEDAAASNNTEAQTDARFALVLLYNREQRYADAQRVIGELQRAFPRNRLLWLEAGATALRAGKAAEAEQHLAAGMKMLAADTRPRMFSEEPLWLQKRGAALVALNRLDEAYPQLQRALTLSPRTWIAGRTHAELGKIADLRRDRAAARAHFQKALTLADQDNDGVGSTEARRWVDRAFRHGG